MTTAVLLSFVGGGKEFLAGTHVHGFRDGELLIAAGAPGAGLDARVVRTVPTADLAFAETCQRDEALDDDRGGPDWSTTWPD